jgi:hypothetical protein
VSNLPKPSDPKSLAYATIFVGQENLAGEYIGRHIQDFARNLALDNPRFDVHKFPKAAGVENT